MAGAKEIRTQDQEHQEHGQKITKAMEMVAAAKMRKAAGPDGGISRPMRKIRTVIGHLMQARPDYRHPFMQEREAKRVGSSSSSTDRGLCGGLNVNLFRHTLREMRAWQEQGVEVDLCLIGAEGRAVLPPAERQRRGQPPGPRRHPARPGPDRRDPGDADAYSEGNRPAVPGAQRVRQHDEPEAVRGDAAAGADRGCDQLQKHWDYIYEPSSMELVEGVLARYIESQVYRGAVENVACEMAARMVAMKSATDNAGKLIDSCSWPTTRRARRRSPRNSPRSSAARRPSDGARAESRQRKLIHEHMAQYRSGHRRRGGREVPARATCRRSTTP
jgi:F-type H+-transporting ATPase subunit gamma